jgi:Na+/melibiose symporter-like transporter
MASDDFNKASKSGWQLYGAVSGCTTSIIIGIFGLAMYTKPDASGWWLAMGIIGVLGAIGSGYNFYNLLKQEMKNNKPPENHTHGHTHEESKPGDEPPPGPHP